MLRAGISHQSAFYAVLLSIGLIASASGQNLHSTTSGPANQAGSSTSNWSLSYSTYIGPEGQANNASIVLLAGNATGSICLLAIPAANPTPIVEELSPGGTPTYIVSVPSASWSLPAPFGGWPFAVAIDSAGDCYLAGVSTAITPTPGVFQTNPKSGQFVEKFGPTGTVVYATYLAGSGPDQPTGMAVDDAGNVLPHRLHRLQRFPHRERLPIYFWGRDLRRLCCRFKPNSLGSGLLHVPRWDRTGLWRCYRRR